MSLVKHSSEGLLAKKVSKLNAAIEELKKNPSVPPNGVVYPNEVQLVNGGFYLLGLNEADQCNAYLPVVDTFDPQTFIISCRNGTSTRFIDRLGRNIITNLDGMVYTGGAINLRFMNFPTQKYKSVTMRKIKNDNGDELIHLEVV